MHDDGELSGNGHSRTLEPDLLPQLEPSAAQAAVRTGTRQDHGGGFIEQAP